MGGQRGRKRGREAKVRKDGESTMSAGVFQQSCKRHVHTGDTKIDGDRGERG